MKQHSRVEFLFINGKPNLDGTKYLCLTFAPMKYTAQNRAEVEHPSKSLNFDDSSTVNL